MKKFYFKNRAIASILFVIIYLSTSPVNSFDKFNKADRVSDYFSGILLLNENQYEKSFNFLKKLNGLEVSHPNFSVKYLYSLVNTGNFKKAFEYSKKLEKQKLETFESQLIIGIYHLKNSDMDLAQKYFLKAKTRNSGFIFDEIRLKFKNFLINLKNFTFLTRPPSIKKILPFE